MKRTLLVLAAVLMLGIGVSPALAWEFSVKAESEIRYRYISRTGPNDLYGNAPYAQSHNSDPAFRVETSIGLSGPNLRYVQVEGYSAKGSDAGYSEVRLWLFPRVDITRAVSMKSIVWLSGNLNGRYLQSLLDKPFVVRDLAVPFPFTVKDSFLGPSANWGTNPHYSGWIMPESRNPVAGVGLAVPIMQALWWTAQTPMATMVFGRRPAGFGLGWVVHERDTYATGLSLLVPYGPFTFVFSQYLHDSGQDTDPNDETNFLAYAQRVFSLEGDSTYQGVPPPYAPPSSVDQNTVIDWNQAVAAVYRSGNLDLGTMIRIVRWGNVHSLSVPGNWPPGRARGTMFDDVLVPSAVGGFSPPGFDGGNYTSVFLGERGLGGFPLYGDMSFLLATSYLRYTDGRLFLNGEYTLQNVEVRRNGGRPISGRPQAWALEGGLLLGPLKLSLAHFYRSGHDRRRGNFDPVTPIGKTLINPSSNDRWNYFLTRWGGGQTPIATYNLLIGLYGTGNNSFNDAGTCTYQDFLAYAARVDYALAANLNLFASVMHAERASNTGTPIGLYDGIYPSNRYRALYPKMFPNPQEIEPAIRGNVPDNDLGLEINAGADWNLLENFTFRFRFAHWQPGNWFKWAYQDRSRFPFNPFLPAVAVNFQRCIDPLIAIETSFLMEF
ncbi:MAG: hypothetical protein HY914_22275 [Desulfomonile tiedjei]|nr:hypothetical protein [Desulfomonile tiedjei]